MIAYFDTSAFLPLVVQEPGTATAVRIWNEAADVVASRLIVVESAAALAQAQRMGRVPEATSTALQEHSSRLIADMTLIDVLANTVDRAALLAAEHGLRGYDAMHLATAVTIRARDVVFVSGDRKLLAAAAAESFATVDSNPPSSAP